MRMNLAYNKTKSECILSKSFDKKKKITLNILVVRFEMIKQYSRYTVVVNITHDSHITKTQVA